MQTLYLLYDSRCELCRRLKDWLLLQRSWLRLTLLPAGSEMAKQLFPDIESIASADDLVVVSDEGNVYLNNHAWIMALYALEEYREWACRLAHPLLLPLARQAFDTLSRNRHAISNWLAGGSPEELAGQLNTIQLEPCARPQETVSDYLR
jgi:predicted DCC family thiol-disulfide oxidoreductase YuxK